MGREWIIPPMQTPLEEVKKEVTFTIPDINTAASSGELCTLGFKMADIKDDKQSSPPFFTSNSLESD